jgi:uncharacterized damage-inducible protein DinB
MRCDHVRLMAGYNQWMNSRLYESAGRLPDSALKEDRGAFFHSVLGTLNHLAVADTIWLKRFAMHPARHVALEPARTLSAPSALDQMLFPDLAQLAAYRAMLDKLILAWAAELQETDLDHVLHYANTRGVVSDKSFFSLLMHFFNHQTHHRGQATTLLSQAGVDIGVTDLIALIPDTFSSRSSPLSP